MKLTIDFHIEVSIFEWAAYALIVWSSLDVGWLSSLGYGFLIAVGIKVAEFYLTRHQKASQ